jgi:hypothetical protein
MLSHHWIEDGGPLYAANGSVADAKAAANTENV